MIVNTIAGDLAAGVCLAELVAVSIAGSHIGVTVGQQSVVQAVGVGVPYFVNCYAKPARPRFTPHLGGSWMI